MITSEQVRTFRGSVNVNVGNNNPAKIFIGAVGIAFVTWLLLTGTLTGLFASGYCAYNPDASFQECCGDAGYGSATYFIFQLIAGACWVVGTGLFWLWSGLGYVLGDLIEGIRTIKAEKQNTNEIAEQVAQQVAVDSFSPGMMEDPIQILNERINRKASAKKVEEALAKLVKDIDFLYEKMELEKPVEPQPVTIESLMAEIEKLKEEKQPATTRRRKV